MGDRCLWEGRSNRSFWEGRPALCTLPQLPIWEGEGGSALPVPGTPRRGFGHPQTPQRPPPRSPETKHGATPQQEPSILRAPRPKACVWWGGGCVGGHPLFPHPPALNLTPPFPKTSPLTGGQPRRGSSGTSAPSSPPRRESSEPAGRGGEAGRRQRRRRRRQQRGEGAAGGSPAGGHGGAEPPPPARRLGAGRAERRARSPAPAPGGR